MGIFAELADNGLWGCIPVVGADRRKESHFGVFALVISGWSYESRFLLLISHIPGAIVACVYDS